MGSTENAREAARQSGGQFGAQEHGAPEIQLKDEALFQLSFQHNDGTVEQLLVQATGQLSTPTRSDSRILTALLGFRIKPFAEGIDLSHELARRMPERAAGLHPVFDTTENFPVALFATVNAFAEVG